MCKYFNSPDAKVVRKKFSSHVLSMDASVTIVRSMDQSNSKRGCRTNNNFTNTLKIEIKVRFFYLFLFFIYFFFIYVRDCRQEQIYSMDRNE